MGARNKYLDKNGLAVRHGDKCIFTHPCVWDKPMGEFHGVLAWNKRLMMYFIFNGSEKHYVPFLYAGKGTLQCGDLVKVVPDRLDTVLSKEELKELEMSWPEFEYIQEPELLAEMEEESERL